MIADRLTEADYEYFSRAQSDLKRAENVRDFVVGILSERYGLSAGDQVTPDGQILRAREAGE